MERSRPPRRDPTFQPPLHPHRVLRRLWLALLRTLPRGLRGGDGAAALRAARLPRPERDELARNLRRMLDPGRAA